MDNDTAERTISVIAKFREVPKDQITLDTTLEELKMDSLDGLNLIFELEEEFDIMIPDDKALKMKTIGNMVTGIDLIRSGESLDDVTEDDFKNFQNAGKSEEVKPSENVETPESVEPEENAEMSESAKTGEIAVEGK